MRGPEPALGQTPPDESKIFTKISTNISGSLTSWLNILAQGTGDEGLEQVVGQHVLQAAMAGPESGWFAIEK